MTEFITIKEAAKLVNISETSIYRWAKKLPKDKVKNQRPFLVSKKMLLSYYNTSKITQNSKDNIGNKQLIINDLQNSTKDFNVKNKVKLNDDDKAFFHAQIKAQNSMIQDLQNSLQNAQNANHNLLLLVGAKEKQVTNLLNRVNQISSKFEEQENEVIEILAQYSTDIEEMKQMIETQKSTSKAENSEFLLIYLGGVVALLISLVVVVLFFS